MGRIDKLAQGLSLKSLDNTEDLELINQYSRRPLTAEEVFCFSVVLCDNDVDRDLERFTDSTLDKLAELFVGKTGISDHRWSAKEQIARLYRVEVEKTQEKNALGEPLKRLRGSAYMLRNEATQPMIDAIEGGILKEVSISCAVAQQTCSICGKPMLFNFRTWQDECESGHIKGQTYDDKLCFTELDNPTDAYEFSFVAVPAQRNAGVTKSAENAGDAIQILMTSDLSRSDLEALKALEKRIQAACLSAEDQKAREKILSENERFLNFEKEI